MSIIFDQYDADEIDNGFHEDNPDMPSEDSPFDDAEIWLAAQDVPDWTA